jgi:hypothetical protein
MVWCERWRRCSRAPTSIERVIVIVYRAARLCGELAHDLGDDCTNLSEAEQVMGSTELTVESHNGEDEHNGQSHNHDGVDLEPGGLIGVEPCTT